jgi:phosphonate transport system ATP-binding protein
VTIYELRGVAHVYPARAGAVRALEDVALRVAPGERVALLGPSGAGKSTLLRLLNATLRPSRGALSFEGRDLAGFRSRELRSVRRRIGTVFQHPSLVPSLTALQNALCGRLGSWGLLRSLRALVAPGAEEVRAGLAALETVGLSGKAAARADELSGGQQQRVAIARVLVQDPEVVLADEPFASLDPGLTVQLADLLFAVTQRRTFVAAMHDVDLALERFQRVVGLRSGRIVFDLPSAEVTEERLHELYARESRRVG